MNTEHRISNVQPRICALAFLATLLFWANIATPNADSGIPDAAAAEAKSGTLTFNGFAALAGSIGRYPDSPSFLADRDAFNWDATFRLLSMAETASSALGMELNLLQTIHSTAESHTGRDSPFLTHVERSGLFTRQEWGNDSSTAFLALDTFFIRRSSERFDLSVGRQPVNLATTFYFTPNDLFAPFAAETFFRVYKPGVDGVRAEIRLADLSQLTLLAVLGYEEEMDSDTGWSDGPALDRTSLLGRYLMEAHGFQWGALAGTLHGEFLAGASLQGEVLDGVGIRAETHTSTEADDQYLAAVIGLEYRFASGLELRFEEYRDTRGFSSADELNRALSSAIFPARHWGRDYSALGMNYQFTPLLVGDLLLLSNWSDHSGLTALNAVYSLADNSEMALGISLPWGSEPEGEKIGSEFGLYPVSLSLDFRHFF